MLSNPAIERRPLPRLRALQHAQLKEQGAYAYERVPLYKQEFDDLGMPSLPSGSRAPRRLHEEELGVEITEDLLRDLGLATVTTDTVQQHHCLQALQNSFTKKLRDNIRLSLRDLRALA